MASFIEARLHEWIVPVTNGFIDISRPCEIDQTHFTIAFFSRRSCARQGTRFNVRGVDRDGQVANFVETEQMVCRDKEVVNPGGVPSTYFGQLVRSFTSTGQISSFVQTRGSVPLFWQQSPTMKYTPKIELTKSRQQSHEAAEKHLREHIDLYGDTLCINLIDRKSDQLKLGNAYQEAVLGLKSPKPKMVWFDFHHETRGGKWNNLSKLLDQVDTELESGGFFYVDTQQGKVLKTQNGVVRTNCVDNLDRTNVVQSLLARRSLLSQLGKTDFQNPLDSGYPAFERVFKGLWADNADALSIFYTGTGALKTDFTRTGKRTRKGELADFQNSVTRYYLNNFVDGYRQDAFDLFLGKYMANNKKNRRTGGIGYVSPFKSKSEPNLLVTMIMALIFFFFALVRCSPKKFRGRDYVSKPSLVTYHEDMTTKKTT